MEIELLKQDPSLIRMLSQWHQAEWGHLSDRGTEERIAEFAEHGSAVPLTLVGYLDGAPIGTASLLAEDMDIRKELTPWLASVFVLPEHRSRGYGTQLVKGIVAEARRLGTATMYLFTEDRAGFYAAMGWQELETTSYHGEDVTIMKLDLTAANGG
jgi:N-acetylglutamate synthase-like GNAT family acetyltransferase